MAGVRRLQKEYRDLLENPVPNVWAAPKSESNIYEWQAKINGPSGTPFENGIFALEIKFPSNYPFKAPKCNFKTKIYHPNISSNGSICLDILSGNWSPVLTLTKVLLSISSLLTDPNPDDPLVSEVASVYKKNKQRYDEMARQWTAKYAIDN